MSRQLIIRNAVRCRRCGDEIESKHRHDFRYCSCGAVAVDGGKAYLRRVASDPALIQDISIVSATTMIGDDGLTDLRHHHGMARKTEPIPGDDLDVGDEVVLRGDVTLLRKNASGAWEVTVQVQGYSQSRITLLAEHVEKADE